MQNRTAALIAASAAAVAVTVTGVTYASADSGVSAREVRPAAAPMGGDHDWDKKDYGRKGDGEIQINERTYSSDPGACVAVVGGGSYNLTNNTDRTLQFFAGATCNAGGPLATVGPNSSSFGVIDGATASFRVVG